MVKRVLCLDGGGVRGVMVARFLMLLEKEMMFRKKGKVRDNFDFFAGTSTGALIVAALGYTDKDCEFISREMYSRQNAKKIMPVSRNPVHRFLGLAARSPKYDGTGKRDLIDTYLTEAHSESKTMEDSDKMVLITSYNLETGRPEFYKSYEGRHMEREVGTVCDASSAAPAYYPSVEMGPGGVNVDGGVCANNPTDCAYVDALSVWGNKEDIRVLSIGTGKSRVETEGITHEEATETIKWGGFQWVTRGDLIEVLMDAPRDCVDYRMKKLTKALGHKYLRVNMELENVKMDDVTDENLVALQVAGDMMFAAHGEKVISFLFDDHN